MIFRFRMYYFHYINYLFIIYRVVYTIMYLTLSYLFIFIFKLNNFFFYINIFLLCTGFKNHVQNFCGKLKKKVERSRRCSNKKKIKKRATKDAKNIKQGYLSLRDICMIIGLYQEDFVFSRDKIIKLKVGHIFVSEIP